MVTQDRCRASKPFFANKKELGCLRRLVKLELTTRLR